MNGAVRVAAALALVGALTACNAGREGTRRDASSVTILYAADERVLGPDWDEAPKFLVFLPLVEMNELGEPQGRLAQRWSHSRDFREWTFHLRQDVRWQDGVAVTAHDVAFTLDLYQGALGWEAPNAYHVRVRDDSTLTITYPKPPQDPFREDRVFWPKHLLERLDPIQIRSWDFWVRPVGDGPYRYVRHVPKTMIELAANPDFYGGTPRIQRVILKFGGGTAITELLSGNVDVVDDFDAANLSRIAPNPHFRTHYYLRNDDFGVSALFWNHRSPLFGNAIVRQALTLGIDRTELRAALNLPRDLPIVDGVFTRRQYASQTLPKPVLYDPDSAARLLDAAGWRDADGNGVRERAGREFRFVVLAAGETVAERAAVIIQAQLRRIGIRMDVQTMEPIIIFRRLRAGAFEAAVFPVVHLRWFGDRSPIGYANPRVVALLRAADTTADRDEIDRIYRELMLVFRADMPVTFLFPNVHVVVVDRRVNGLRSPFQADPFVRMEHLWLADER